MDVSARTYGPKRVYEPPAGFRELCTDISREETNLNSLKAKVLRSQPDNIYAFIADYVNGLLITRENTKAALIVVNDVLRDSEAIMSVLNRAGLNMSQVDLMTTAIQQAFRNYLDSLHGPPPCSREEETSKFSTEKILEEVGVTVVQAERAATVIQRPACSRKKKPNSPRRQRFAVIERDRGWMCLVDWSNGGMRRRTPSKFSEKQEHHGERFRSVPVLSSTPIKDITDREDRGSRYLVSRWITMMN